MSNSLNLTDIQFVGNDTTTQKLRRLVQDLVAAEAAVNTLINQVSTLQTEVGSTGTQEVLATTKGLGPNFTVSGLTEGQVLKALSATSAAFAKLTLSDLANVLIENAENGQVLTYINNQWVNESPAAGPSAPQGQNQGTGIDIYAGLSGGNLVFNSITGDGSSINVDIVGDTIVVSFIGSAGGNGVIGMQGPPGFEADPEPGEPGPPGQIGPQGIQGIPGATGGTTVVQYLMVDNPDAGDQGDPGPPGQIGPQGIPGTNGTGGGAATYLLIDSDSGADGEPGPPGAAGVAGTSNSGGPSVFGTFVPFTTSGWTQYNLSSQIVTNSGGILRLYEGVGATSGFTYGRTLVNPSAFTVTAFLSLPGTTNINNYAGIVIQDSATGNMKFNGWGNSQWIGIDLTGGFNTGGSYHATPWAVNPPGVTVYYNQPGPGIWMQMARSGSTIAFSISLDGQTFIPIGSDANGWVANPTDVGIYLGTTVAPWVINAFSFSNV